MKKFNLILMFMALVSVAMVSCTEDTTDPTPSAQPELTITSEATMEFAAEGGDGEIVYTLKHAKVGIELTAECAADWVTDLTVGETITFVVTANEGEVRDTKVVVTYDDKVQEVAIIQAGNSSGDTTALFEVTIGETTSSSVAFTVTPADAEAEYIIALYDAATADEYKRDTYLINALYAELEAEAASKGKTMDEYMPEFVDKGVVEDTFTNLAPDTDYYIIVFGVDAENGYVASTEVVKEPFKTQPLNLADITFEINTTVDGNTAEFEVKPSDAEAIWYFYTLPKSTFDAYTDPAGNYQMTEVEFILYCLQMQIEQLRGAGYTDNQILNAIFHKGTLTLLGKDLIANTEYVGLVAAFDVTAEGNVSILSDVTTATYTTGEVKTKDFTLTVSVTDIESNRAAIKVTPSDNKESFCWLCAEWDGVQSAEEVMNEIVALYGSWMNSGMMLYYGVQDYTGGPGSQFKYKLAAADTDYYVIAFGYAGGVTTAPVMETFRTLPAPDPATTEFTMTASNLSPYGFTANVTATHDSTYYTAGICYAEEYDEETFTSELNAAFDDMLAQATAFDPNTTAAMLLDQYFYNGNASVSANGMTPETEVMGYIFALDPKTGHVVKTHTFNPLATTTALGSVTPVVELVGYYSGDEENGAVFGQPDATKGKSITVVKYTGLDNARSLFTCSVEGDAENTLGFPDTQLWQQCTGYWASCKLNTPYTFYVSTWEQDLTAVAYAVDNAGLIGGIGRLRTRATAAEKGDIADLKTLVDELNAIDKSHVAMPTSLVVREEPVAQPAVRPAAQPVEREAVVTMPVVEEPMVELTSNEVMLLSYIRPFYIRK